MENYNPRVIIEVLLTAVKKIDVLLTKGFKFFV